MCEQGFAEFCLHVCQCRRRTGAALVQDNEVDQSRRVGQRLGNFRSVARGDRASQGKRFQDADEVSRIMSLDQPVGLRIGRARIQSRSRQDHRLLDNLLAAIEMDRMKVAKGPQRELAKAAELVGIMTAKSTRIEPRRRLLQLDESSCRLSLSGDRQIGTADTAFLIFGQHAWRQAETQSKQLFKQ